MIYPKQKYCIFKSRVLLDLQDTAFELRATLFHIDHAEIGVHEKIPKSFDFMRF